MKYYEIILMINPDQSDQINNITEYYKKFIIKNNGSISRFEDWGRRQLAYPILKLHKAHYILINIILNNNNIINNLEKNFRINENIIRYLIIKTKTDRKNISCVLKLKDKRQEKRNDVIKTI
ncbi:30S ribosomal protein S6 [Enterobacteriaceae endosymbiont of Donacia bicoloricornis]|uniref:30S ribosomal protein S6 n=1 Tax=Enterobacteriaceae endosymbiont of Donacia bicoloricornis TaxID=2675772 RepID=UPI001449900A|nr:30S ribosomal protein S6 [Enterobacteriaceae endosymbiont of Donacia bicoloricornis]QJC37847.1 30S ribosomal protein S6 [Enterobacteriaceae endosymbiont of Donacia bicoloricornis]